MKILLVHPGSSVATHDVFMGILDALMARKHQVSVYPLDEKIGLAVEFLKLQRKRDRAVGRDVRPATPLEVQLQACDSLITRALVLGVDWVVVVTSMFVPPAIVQVMRMAGIKVAVVMTESPYDEAQESRIGAHANVVFTNEKRTAEARGWVYLPHAWRKAVHSATTPVEADATRADRVIFVGSGFPERIAWLERFVVAGAPLDLYGTWDNVGKRSPLRAHMVGPEINNDEVATLYRQYGCALNLYRTSRGWHGQDHIGYGDAYSLSPRAYELAALGVPHVSSVRAETTVKFGDLVPQVSTPEEGAEEVEKLLRATSRDRRILGQQLSACVADDHWDARIEVLLKGLANAAA